MLLLGKAFFKCNPQRKLNMFMSLDPFEKHRSD